MNNINNVSNATTVSVATLRREKKLVEQLCALVLKSSARFQCKWYELLRCWSLEAYSRGRRLQNGREGEENKLVFDILEKAKRLLAKCGPEAERLVGAKTRELLSHDCSKAVALAVDSNMYHLSVNLYKPKPRPCKKVARAKLSTSTQGA
jgi:hypothetical protein